ncbi:MAG: outer membrane lipoprotein-sorting protein [Pseudomonadota bacterium]
MRFLPLLSLAIGCLALTGAAPAEDPLVRGEEIAREAERRDKGFIDSIASVEMILTDKSGGEASRYLTIKTFERSNTADGHKSLVIFHEPLDVKGTTLLTHGEILEADQQWLYLPALKRVKRVPSSNKAGPFMASEFSYEDMLPPEVERYTHRLLGEVRCGDLRCFKIERTPKDKDSGYAKQIAFLDAEHYRLQRVEYFDRKDTHFKTLYFSDYAQYDDKHWRAANMTMVNHRSGKTTFLIWSAFAFKNGFTSADFSRVAMRQ